MEGRALSASLSHGGACAARRTGMANLTENRKSSAGNSCCVLFAFALLTIFALCIGLSPAQVHAAGAFAAPAVKNRGQVRVDDEARRLVYPNALGYDAAYDEIYLINGGSNRVVVYGPDFFPRASIGAGRGIISPTGVTVAPNGEVYVAQVRTKLNPYPRITILNAAFFIDREIFFDEIPEADGFIPKRIALGRDGLIYVSGENTRGVMVLDYEGIFLRWMQPTDLIYSRNALEEGENPSGVKEEPIAPVEDSPTAEEVETAIRVEEDPYANIPEEFRPRESVPGAGLGATKVEAPVLVNFVTIDSTGKIYLLSNETGKVYVYGPDENLLFSFGTKGGSPGQLSQPRAVAIDEQNELIYVADFMRHSILIYDMEGEYLFEVGGRGSEPGYFNFPNAMLMNKHQQYVVADLFNARVQVLELGYNEWLNRFEIGEEVDALPAEAEDGGLETSTETEIFLPAAEDQEEQPRQEVSDPESQEGGLGIIVPGRDPGTAAEGAQSRELSPGLPSPDGESESTGQQATPLQPEKVIEVILPEDEIPTFQDSRDR